MLGLTAIISVDIGQAILQMRTGAVQTAITVDHTLVINAGPNAENLLKDGNHN